MRNVLIDKNTNRVKTAGNIDFASEADFDPVNEDVIQSDFEFDLSSNIYEWNGSTFIVVGTAERHFHVMSKEKDLHIEYGETDNSPQGLAYATFGKAFKNKPAVVLEEEPEDGVVTTLQGDVEEISKTGFKITASNGNNVLKKLRWFAIGRRG
jgi:hypothetical protein